MNNTESDTKNLSAMLIEAMKIKGFSLEKLAQTTGVSDRFIEYLLGEKFDQLPSSPYMHGYILKIGEALDLDGERLWREFFKNSKVVRTSGASDALPGNEVHKKRINKKVTAIIVFIVIALSYITFRIQTYFGEPYFILENLTDNMIVTEQSFTIKGKINTRDQIMLNGEQVYPNEEGVFEKKIQLQSGFNALSFKIKKFLGKEYIIDKQIFYKTQPKVNTQTINTEPQIESGQTNVETILPNQ